MSAIETLPSLYPGCREHLSMVKTAKMELLRALVSECLSAAAEEVFRIVERTIRQYEEDMSCSSWVVDSHHRLLDVAKSQSEDSLQMCVTDEQQQQQLPASVDVSVCWEEADDTTSRPTRQTERPNSAHPDLPLISVQSRRDSQMDSEEDDLKILKAKKPFECPVCLSGFSSKKTMVRHVKKHPEDKSSSYQCQFCGRYFRHKSEFIIHTRIHKGAKLYKCQDCEKSFECRDRLFTHRQRHADLKSGSRMESEPDPRQKQSRNEIFPLAVTPYDKSEFDQESLQPLCLYQIQTVADIDKDSAPLSVDHIKTEAGADEQQVLLGNPGEQDMQPKHVPNILNQRPSGKSNELIVQFEAGTAQKPYKCPCCTKCFSLTKTLIRHVKIHTEDKPYQCQFCGRNFCQKSDLVNHTRIHTGERPYQCHECHKSFAQKGNLVVHMRRHMGQKPYQCQNCSCRFMQKSSLDCHMLSHS